MCDHVLEAVALSKGRSRNDLDSDRILFLAMVKLVEIVGEAATRVPDFTQADHPEIPWHEIVGTRNRLIHGYDAVDNDILWNIVTLDFPTLATRLRALLP